MQEMVKMLRTLINDEVSIRYKKILGLSWYVTWPCANHTKQINQATNNDQFSIGLTTLLFFNVS